MRVVCQWVFLSAVLFPFQTGVGLAQDGKPEMKISPEAMEIHQSGMLFDGHNDLPFAVRLRGGSSFDRLDISKPTELHTDINRLRAGGLKGQFWSVYVPADTDLTGNALLMTLEQIQIVHDMCSKYPDTFEMADTAADVRRIIGEGKIASMIGVEGGHSIENSLQVLRMLYQRGARYMTLTHSKTLAWADSATDEAKNNGLSRFGKEVVREMNRIGMLVDLSHVSEKCMEDALSITLAPVIFSHSSAKAICGHPRNVSDNVLKLTAKNGGVVMVNFMSGYIVPLDELESSPKARGDYKLVCDHIEHIIKVAGIDHVGIGSDFDGVSSLPIGLDDVSYYPNITQELLNRGYNKEQLHKILGGNVLRVLEQAEAVSAKLKSGELSFPNENAAGEALFALTVGAGDLDRNQSVVQTVVKSDSKLPAIVSLEDAQGTAMIGQVTPLADAGNYQLTFHLPELKQGESVSLTAREQGLNANRSFAWSKQDHSDELEFGGRPVVRLMREPLDESTEERRAETYKPYHHVFTPDGKQLITKGAGGLFPHHRGIFYGFNRISIGDQKADTWHCKDGAYESLEKSIEQSGGPVFARDRNLIHWHGTDGKTFAAEDRDIRIHKLGDATLIDVRSTLTNLTDKTIQFQGDPQHAGVQIRASQEVPDHTKHLTYYVRPDGVGEPGAFRNWSANKGESDVNKAHVDLDFLAVVIGMPKDPETTNEKLPEAEVDRFTIGYFPDAGNPSPERFSERDYGRFGCYFEKELPAGEAFSVRYQFLIHDGQLGVEELAKFRQEFASPVSVTQD